MELPFQNLLKELSDYDPDPNSGMKAHRIYVKCLRKGHPKIAERIKNKYERYFPKSDWAIAMMWSLSIGNSKL